MPIRKTMRRSSGTPALRSTMAFCTSIAQRTASTTLRNSTIEPSPVRLTTRPLCTAMVGSMRSLRSALSRAKMLSSSAPASREIADHVRAQNRRKLACFRHWALRRETSTNSRRHGSIPPCGGRRTSADRPLWVDLTRWLFRSGTAAICAKETQASLPR